MQTRCYFCDEELKQAGHLYKVGLRDELICDECYVKMINRRKALESGSG